MAGLSRGYVGKKAFAKVGGGARVAGEKGNRRVEMNCGDPCDARVGPTADPADRAHGVTVIVDRKGAKDDGCTLLVPAAVKERRGRAGARASRFEPAWHATKNLVARPRRYHESNMRGTLVEAGFIGDADGVRRRAVLRVIGRVSLDSVEDDLVERAAAIKAEMEVDLLRGGVGASNRAGEVFRKDVRFRDILETTRLFDSTPVDQGGGREVMHELRVKRFLDRYARPPKSTKSSVRSACDGRARSEKKFAVENGRGVAPGLVAAPCGVG